MADGFDLAGSLIGAGVGLYNVNQSNKRYRQKRDAGLKAVAEADKTYQDIIDQLDLYRAGQRQLATPEMYDAYGKLVSEFDPSQYDYQFDKFEYGKDVSDFINPYYDKIIGETAGQIQQTAAGAGLGRGTGAATDIARGVAQKEDELYKTALQEYNTDRAQQYQEYNDYIRNMQNRYNNLANLTSQRANLLSGAISHDETQESDYMADLLGLMGERAKTRLEGTITSFA